MRIPDTVAHHLHAKAVPFTLIRHSPTRTSLATAHAANVPGRKLAKAIVIEDGTEYSLAVLPATYQVDWDELSSILKKQVHLADESDLPMLLRDCQLGAVPPVGEPYGVKTIVESDLGKEEDLYLESGDHEHLVHVDREGFKRLLGRARTGHFSRAIA